MRTFLASLPTGWWIGPSIGFALFLISYILNRRSRIGPRLVYQQQALRLLGSTRSVLPEEVEIYFKNQRVPLLARCYVVLWNSGTQTIHSSDIVSGDPIRIVVSHESRLLQARVIASTRPVIQFQIRSQPCISNSVLCEFDYLDPGDGATIEILHTDEKEYPSILGTIRGMPRGLRDWGRSPFVDISQKQISFYGWLTLPIFLFFGGVFIFLLSLRPDWYTSLWEPDFIILLRGIGVFYGIGTSAVVIWAFWGLRHRIPRKLLIDKSI